MSCSSSCSGCSCCCPSTFSLDRNWNINGLCAPGDADITIPNDVDQIHLTIAEDADPTTPTVTLPQAPRIGQRVLVVAGVNVAPTVTGGQCWDIAGGDVNVTAGQTREFTFGADQLWHTSEA